MTDTTVAQVAHIPIYGWIFLSLIALMLCATIFFAVYLIYKTLSGKKSLRIGNLEADGDYCDTSMKEHSQCTKYRDILYIMRGTREVDERVHYIRDIEILDGQMSDAELTADKCKAICEDFFIQILLENGENNPLQATAYNYFIIFTQYVVDRALKQYRHLCRSTSFSAMKPDEFMRFALENSEACMRAVEATSNKYFPFRFYVDGYSRLHDLYPKLKNLYIDSLSMARDIESRKMKEIQDIEEQFDREFMTIVGLDPDGENPWKKR